jgi:hypothetical protein
VCLREEHRLREGVENRVPRRIFGPKRDEVTGEWRKLHSEELHNLFRAVVWVVLPCKMIPDDGGSTYL